MRESAYTPPRQKRLHSMSLNRTGIYGRQSTRKSTRPGMIAGQPCRNYLVLQILNSFYHPNSANIVSYHFKIYIRKQSFTKRFILENAPMKAITSE